MGTVFGWVSHCIALLSKNSKKHSLIPESSNSGQWAEQRAADYLRTQGLKLLKKNHSTKAGEIDLIMRHEHCVVFVEVKYRTASEWAQAAETVTIQKQQRIIKAAKQYLQVNKLFDQVDCRFDVVTIDKSGDHYEIDWIKHAFY